MVSNKEGYPNYERVAQPVNTDLEWALFVSKDFNGPPIRDFQLERVPTCYGRRLSSNDKTEQLSFANKAGLDAYRN